MVDRVTFALMIHACAEGYFHRSKPPLSDSNPPIIVHPPQYLEGKQTKHASNSMRPKTAVSVKYI